MTGSIEIVPRGGGSGAARTARALPSRRRAGARVTRVLNETGRIPALRPETRIARRLWEGLDGPAVIRVAASDSFIGWLGAMEEQLRLLSLARAARRGGGPASVRWVRLMEACEKSGMLGAAAPRGRLPRDFPARARRLALREALESLREVAALLVPHLPRAARRGRVVFTARADPSLGRPAGAIEFPEAGVTWSVPRRLARDPAGVRARLRAAEIRIGGARLDWPEADPSLPNPSVGAPVRPTLLAVRVLAQDKQFADRVALALEDLRVVWDDAERLVRTVTRRVVPLFEPGTVSFSSASVPGVSYINIRSAPRIRLAEDLLHEAVHERLHRIERVHPLVDPESPRVYSPWRREWRPLRGLVHGACTFGTGASFFSRALAASAGPRPVLRLTRERRLWIARRLVEERDALGEALRILSAARREGWLRPAGARLERAVRSGWRALGPEAARCLALLERSLEARGHVAALRRQRERTGARAVRWSAGWNPSPP